MLHFSKKAVLLRETAVTGPAGADPGSVGNQHRQQSTALSSVAPSGTATHNVTGITPGSSVSQIRPISVPR